MTPKSVVAGLTFGYFWIYSGLTWSTIVWYPVVFAIGVGTWLILAGTVKSE